MLKLGFLYFCCGCCPLTLSQGTTGKRLAPPSLLPLLGTYTHGQDPAGPVLLQAEASQVPQVAPCVTGHTSLSAIFKALCTTHSSKSMSDLYWESQDWTQHFRRVSPEQQEKMISSDPILCINPVWYYPRTHESALYSILTFTSHLAFTLFKLNIDLLITCLIFSRSWSGEANELILKLFLNMAIRVFASLRWILGSRALSWVCLFFNSSIRRWLYLCICSVSWNSNHVEKLHSNYEVIQCASLVNSKSPVSQWLSAPGISGEQGLLPESSGSCPTQRKFSTKCK